MSATIRFDDGAAYEDTMGRWSEAAAAHFLAWLAPPQGAAWLDIGCGTGVFSRMIERHCAPAVVTAIDPSQAQLDQARRLAPGIHFHLADAQSLPFPAGSFGQAVMALVIFFLPSPDRGVAEMARVLQPGGTASAYVWDSEGTGSPLHPIAAALQARGHAVPSPPSPGASGLAALRALWSGAGFTGIETTSFDVALPFPGFAAYWSMMARMPRIGPVLATLPPQEADAIRTELRTRLAAAETPPFTATARANAIRGTLP